MTSTRPSTENRVERWESASEWPLTVTAVIFLIAYAWPILDPNLPQNGKTLFRAAPGIFVTAESTTSSAGARADQNGLFKIQASNFTAPDCKVTVSDRQTPTATVTLSGCTPTVTPVPPVPAPPTGSCVITPQAPATVTAGTSSTVNFQSTGCNTTFNSGATPTPVQWKVVAGTIPTGMTGPNFQGTTAANIIGTPSIRGTYQFTLQVTDQVGATDQENFTVNVA